MSALDPKKWRRVYSGRICNVYQLRDLRNGRIYLTADRGEKTPGWRYSGNSLDAARNASNNKDVININPPLGGWNL